MGFLSNGKFYFVFPILFMYTTLAMDNEEEKQQHHNRQI